MMICVLIINVKKGVQQLRLDFQMFEVGVANLICVVLSLIDFP